MVVIPAGSFMMGSPAAEAGRRDNEPQSRVAIARAFAVSKTEVTWDQWEACVRDRGCDGMAIDADEEARPTPWRSRTADRWRENAIHAGIQGTWSRRRGPAGSSRVPAAPRSSRILRGRPPQPTRGLTRRGALDAVRTGGPHAI
jgi:formylglycine-generating enzyme required for sulfatase activity